jgi:hypothetical protein
MVNPLTYPTSSKPFSQETFNSPPSEYRGAPFWSWNHKQDKAKTVGQVDMFEEMGMGGFHMHTRVGLDIPYMGEEFMDIVKGCVQKAKEKGMQAFLYDEDRYVFATCRKGSLTSRKLAIRLCWRSGAQRQSRTQRSSCPIHPVGLWCRVAVPCKVSPAMGWSLY